MATKLPFGDIVESAAGLPVEDQESLIEILQNRLRESRRAALVRDVQDAQEEFRKGECSPARPDELMREITS
jgi:hypothetical protein